MPKRIDTESRIKAAQLQAKNGVLYTTIGLSMIVGGAYDAWLGEKQIDTEFSRQFPRPISRQQSDVSRERVNRLNRTILVDALNGKIPPESVKQDLDANSEITQKYDSQTSYRNELRKFWINIDLNTPKDRFPLDLLAMIGGTALAAFGADLRRLSLLEIYHYTTGRK